MSVYFDASALVPLVTVDPFTQRMRAFLLAEYPQILVSDFASAELSSVLARRVRMSDLDPGDASQAFARFDEWVGRAATRVAISSADIDEANALIRQLDMNLRAPDAIHLQAARRLGAQLATFDNGMTAAARALDIDVATL